jgi:hypothetical protein
MVDKPEATGPEPQGAPSPRRRFLKHGLTAAGGTALLLSSTRHAVAKVSKGGGVGCGMLTWSGHQSAIAKGKTGGNVSKSVHGKKFCPGLSPGYWAPPGNPTQHVNQWAVTGCVPTGKNATTFKSCFGTAPGYGFPSNATLYTVIETTPDTPARQFAAAYLDARGGVSNYAYTPIQIKDIWLANYANSSKITAYSNYFSQYLNVA